MQRDLFYSPNEKIIFEIVGYSPIESTSNVKEIISVLQNNYNFFEKLFKTKTINTREITSKDSRRYKNMRVFWAEMSPENVPSEAFTLSTDWTMEKWINF